MVKKIDYEKLWKQKQEKERQRQREWRETQKKKNKTPFTVWITESEKQEIETLKKDLNLTNSEVFSKILNEYKNKGSFPSISMEETNRETYKKIQKLRKDGKSFQQISDHLNEEGTPTFTGRGKWNKSTVSKIEKNPPDYLKS